MENFGKALKEFCDSVRIRFENDAAATARSWQHLGEAFTARDKQIIELQQIVIQLRKEVADLQSVGTEKILLIDPKV